MVFTGDLKTAVAEATQVIKDSATQAAKFVVDPFVDSKEAIEKFYSDWVNAQEVANAELIENNQQTQQIISDETDIQISRRLAKVAQAKAIEIQNATNTSKSLLDSSINLTNAIGEQIERRSDDEKAGQIKAAKFARASAVIQKISSVLGIIANTAIARAKSFALSPLTFGEPFKTAATVSGVIGAAAVAAQPLPAIPKFQQGGVISGLSGNLGQEDGIIAAQNGESVLNRQATTELGQSTINALNAGQTTGFGNVTINVQDGRDAVETLDDYFKTRGTSERGLSL